jgi:group II intron reverse transcriptase/maturase
MRFTALLHHVDLDLLRSSYRALNDRAAPGVDGMTKREYEDGLEGRLEDLRERIHTGRYRAQPSRRTYIPKPDGRQRPLGVAALEDKIAQQALVTVLNNVYEEDFLGFSYGFRPGRKPHDALDALYAGIHGKKVNWVLDADIQGFFDAISHEWMMKFLEHRIADKRVLRLVRKWLRAGVSEDGEWSKTTVGTPQGAVISPLLANVFLHYVLDLWAHKWRKTEAKGDVLIVRYADDFVMGFQHRHEAERFLKELGERLGEFGLKLHPEKTRLIEFGRFAAQNRKKRGDGKPESFDFLGFTHRCGTTKKGKFKIDRKTAKKRLRAKITEVRKQLMAHRHDGIHVLGKWLRAVITGYMNYHAIHGNLGTMNTFRSEVIKAWFAALRRRGQKARLTWEKFRPWVRKWIPSVRLKHPYPLERFYAIHPR